MIEVGRLCIKIAGRDAGGKCVVVDVLDDNYVMVDGQVRRRKCNINHLELLNDVIKIEKGASHEAVKAEFEKLKIPMWETKPKEKKEKPKKVRGKKKKVEEEAAEAKGKKKITKKAAPKKEEKPAKKPEEAESVEELLGGEAEVKGEVKK